MKVAFFDNGNLGIEFAELMNRINKDSNIEVCMIVLSERKANKYSREYGIKTVFANGDTNSFSKHGLDIILDIESKYEKFSLNKAIMLDRVANRWPSQKSINYFTTFTQNVYELIKQENIDIVFGEVTWACEFIVFHIMKLMGREYYNPLISSVIPGRFAFMSAFCDDSFMVNDCVNDTINNEVKRYMQKRMEVNINDDAKFLKATIPVNLVSRMKHLTNMQNNQDYRYSLGLKFNILKKYINKSWQSYACKNIFHSFDSVIKEYSNKRLVLLALHVQPEATPDVVSAEYSNQYELAVNIARNLPADCLLLIKEHPNGIGSRSMSALKKFSKLPNSILLDPFEQTQKLFSKLEAVFTIAGTVAFEASLHGVQAYVFSEIYYNIFPFVNRVEHYSQIKDMILKNRENSQKVNTQEENLAAYAKIYANTYEGLIYDPFLNGKALSHENLEKVKHSFINFIEQKK